MNRAILFRGKRLDNDEWVQGYYCKRKTGYYTVVSFHEEYRDCIIKEFSDGGIIFCDVDPSTVCQYTGLKDENGKEIYEEDIVGTYSGYSEERDYAVVKYGEFNCSCCDGVYGWYFEGGDIRDVNLYKVCGNIYDNPELLEGGYSKCD